ncbi:Mrsp1 [Arthroderma uncinatum]|uniref:Mrsp1 n=1 Tax=Arthroderma uncinatum TaxID=74035 RepID=UPI00144A5401|nr:Mrsp1 [Arthroderma uncinatum]KAF3481063.1 Mrsp1 [Arthroderma uncinatum]
MIVKVFYVTFFLAVFGAVFGLPRGVSTSEEAHITKRESRIIAKNTSTGKTIRVTIADTCDACGPNDVDFALGPWKELTNNAAPGVFTVTWHWA